MTCCGHPVIEWEEATRLAAPPDWWPEGMPYDPNQFTARQTLCLRCGRHAEEYTTDGD